MADAPSCDIDSVALTHGQARWVLWHLRLRAGEDEVRFDAWLKYVRRTGVPFDADELGRGAGVNVEYRFPHLMELAVALGLRSLGVLPRDLLRLLARHRQVLRELYGQAWLERESGLGAPIVLQDAAGTRILGRGTHLNLWLDYDDHGVLLHSRPELIGPLEAVRHALAGHSMRYPRPPLPVSDYARDIMHLIPAVPEIRRGRP